MKLFRASLRLLRSYRDFGAGFVTGGVLVGALMVVAMVAPASFNLAISALEATV